MMDTPAKSQKCPLLYNPFHMRDQRELYPFIFTA